MSAQACRRSWLDDPDDGSCRTIDIPGRAAPQSAESTADASQLGGLPTVVTLKLGCFNCGIGQEMLFREKHQMEFPYVVYCHPF